MFLFFSGLLKFPAGSDILALNFFSDGYRSGRGFDIEVTQRRNTCRIPVSGKWPPNPYPGGRPLNPYPGRKPPNPYPGGRPSNPYPGRKPYNPRINRPKFY